MRPLQPRRGSCLVQTLIGLALIGLLLLIVGVVGMLTSKASSAVQDIQSQIETLRNRATVFEAPASIELELGQGGALVALAPDGMVGDKKLGPPPASARYEITVTDAEGKAVRFERANQPRNPAAPFEMLGTFAVDAAGRYTVKVDGAGDNPAPAAVMVASASTEEIETLANSGVAILQGLGGACSAICGLVAFVGFGIPALIMRARARQKPPEVLPDA